MCTHTSTHTHINLSPLVRHSVKASGVPTLAPLSLSRASHCKGYAWIAHTWRSLLHQIFSLVSNNTHICFQSMLISYFFPDSVCFKAVTDKNIWCIIVAKLLIHLWFCIALSLKVQKQKFQRVVAPKSSYLVAAVLLLGSPESWWVRSMCRGYQHAVYVLTTPLL